MEKPARYLRLKENHPTFQKVQKLFETAEDLGIEIAFYGHRTVITDDEFPDRIYDISDLENADDAPSAIPCTLEYAIWFENPKYTEYCLKMEEEYNRHREEERKAQAYAEAQERKRREEEERKRVEDAERKLLSELKKKYE